MIVLRDYKLCFACTDQFINCIILFTQTNLLENKILMKKSSTMVLTNCNNSKGDMKIQDLRQCLKYLDCIPLDIKVFLKILYINKVKYYDSCCCCYCWLPLGWDGVKGKEGISPENGTNVIRDRSKSLQNEESMGRYFLHYIYAKLIPCFHQG